MDKRTRYSPEGREWAVRLVFEYEGEYYFSSDKVGRLVQTSTLVRADRRRATGRERTDVLSKSRVGQGGVTHNKESPEIPGRFTLPRADRKRQ